MSDTPTPNTVKASDEVKAAEQSALLDALREALGKPEMTEDEAIAYVKDNVKPEDEEKKDEEKKEPPAAEPEAAAASGDISASNDVLSVIKEQLALANAELKEYRIAEANSLIDLAITKKTVHAGQRAVLLRLSETSPNDFRELVGSAPRTKVVPVGMLVSKPATTDVKATQTEQSEFGKNFRAGLFAQLKHKPKGN